MKQLHYFILITALFIFISSFKYHDNKNLNDNSNIEVVFNHKLSFNDIVKIKLDLSEKGITLTYRKLLFDENAKLISIDFYVKFNDGYGGSDAADNLTDQSRIGFYRDYSKNAKRSFICGNLEKLQTPSAN